MNSTESMKFLVTGDLHQCIEKWEELVKFVGKEKPRFVLIAGDLLPKTGGYAAQKDFFPELSRYCREMKRRDPVTVLTYLGNDDFHVLEPLLDQLEAEGLCVNLNGRIHREAGLIFCGMNKVRDYPLGYKHWCVPDENFLACPQQYCGEGLTVNEKGEFVPLDNLVAHLFRQAIHQTGTASPQETIGRRRNAAKHLDDSPAAVRIGHGHLWQRTLRWVADGAAICR
jgi:hypothetical protein